MSLYRTEPAISKITRPTFNLYGPDMNDETIFLGKLVYDPADENGPAGYFFHPESIVFGPNTLNYILTQLKQVRALC